MRKKRFLLFILIALLLTSCNNDISSKDSKRPIVYTSFFPIYDLTKSIGKDDVEIRPFMPLNATAHQWEPSPKKMRDLAHADMLIVNGANMERWVDKVADNLPDLKIVRLSDKAELIKYTGAAAIGDFQYSFRSNFNKGQYPIIFGHTHEYYMRLAFFKDDGSLNEDELVLKGRELMEDTGKRVKQNETFKVEDGAVYQIEMGHQSGEVYFDIAESGNWIVYSDRLSEELLSFSFLDQDEKDLEKEVLLEGSSQGVDQITYDPHSWLSFTNSKLYLDTIAHELGELLPEKARKFDRNRFTEVDKIAQMEMEYKEKFKDISHREFIVIHYAFEYLARELDLVQYPLQGLTSMNDPSIKAMTRTIDFANEAHLKTIFYEYGSSMAIADILAEEIPGAKVKPLASMEYLLPGASIDDYSYLDLLKMNLDNLYDSMK